MASSHIECYIDKSGISHGVWARCPQGFIIRLCCSCLNVTNLRTDAWLREHGSEEENRLKSFSQSSRGSHKIIPSPQFGMNFSSVIGFSLLRETSELRHDLSDKRERIFPPSEIKRIFYHEKYIKYSTTFFLRFVVLSMISVPFDRQERWIFSTTTKEELRCVTESDQLKRSNCWEK